MTPLLPVRIHCRCYRFMLAGLLSLALLVCLLPAAPALANTFTPTLTIDLTDINPGDGRCDAFLDNIAPGDQCTLRAAIQESNALAGADTIILPAQVYTLTLNGAGDNASVSGDLDINDHLTLTGAGAAITIIQGEPGWDDRLIEIDDPAQVELSQVTLRYGKGGISNGNVLTLTNSIVISNTAGSGGGIANFDRLTLLNSMVLSNTSNTDAGGILNTAGGQLTILNSTISYNHANGEGGGLKINSGTVTVTNSTISYNKANSFGGGIDGGPFNLTNVTLTHNVADADNNGFGNYGGLSGSSFSLASTILANNTTSNGLSSDCSGTGISHGFNFLETSECTFSGNTASNIIGQEPLLGPLQDNGGPTLTHLPLPGSPVIDKGNPALPGSGGQACPAADQRGVARPIGSLCDIGATEAPRLVYLPKLAG